jgi:hypothetical protein
MTLIVEIYFVIGKANPYQLVRMRYYSEICGDNNNNCKET